MFLSNSVYGTLILSSEVAEKIKGNDSMACGPHDWNESSTRIRRLRVFSNPRKGPTLGIEINPSRDVSVENPHPTDHH